MAKGPDAFRTISEAAAEVGVPAHVLRFWETKFPFLQPLKRAGGRRLYRPQEIEVLRGVRTLLHDQGYTIRGVQRLHQSQGWRRVAEAGEWVEPARPTPVAAPAGGDLNDALSALEQARDRLRTALKPY